MCYFVNVCAYGNIWICGLSIGTTEHVILECSFGNNMCVELYSSISLVKIFDLVSSRKQIAIFLYVDLLKYGNLTYKWNSFVYYVYDQMSIKSQ